MGRRIYIVLAVTLLAGCDEFKRRINCNATRNVPAKIEACLAEPNCRVTAGELSNYDWHKANCPV